MMTKPQSKFRRLERDGRLTPRAGEFDSHVVAADQDRVDPAADYLFCAPDLLFPADGVGRALHLDVDPRPAAVRKRAGSKDR